MLCLQCKNRNPVGNKFCRECGAKLSVPQDVLAAEEAARAEAERTSERVARLLTDARLLAEQSKIEQAILLTEEAAEQMPGSSSAHALLASLYERTGSITKAVMAMERVVALNPESEADKATLERLRLLEAANPEVRLLVRSQTPDMARPTASQSLWLPVAAAGIAGAFVLGVGLSVVNSRTVNNAAPRVSTNLPASAQVARNDAAQTPYTTTLPGQATTPGSESATGTGAIPPKVSLPPPVNSSEDPFAGQNTSGTVPNARPATPATGAPVSHRPPSLSSATSSLPLPGELTRNTTLGPAPVKLIGVPTNNSSSPGAANNTSSGETFGQGGRLTVGAPVAGESTIIQAAPPTPAPQGDGYIRISVRPPKAAEGASSSSRAVSAESSGSSSGAFLRAQSQQSAGQYSEAVSSYQRSVSTDPDSAGEAYQGMALCYQHMNDTGSARAAYRNAISAYERQGGRSAQSAIATCKAALEVLGGG